MINPTDAKPQFKVNVAVLPARGLQIELRPQEGEHQQLAQVADILSVKHFVAKLVFRRWHKNGVSVKGEIRAQITQQCVITLEPVETKVEETFEQIFVPDGSMLTRPNLNQEGEWVLDYDGPDIPDPFVGDTLDAWEIVIEHFVLGIDPFVRKEGADFDAQEAPHADSSQESDRANNPFAALKGLLDE